MAGTLYDLLGLNATANAQEIHTAYRRLAQVYHPDKSSGDEESFKRLNEAHRVLGNPYKRGLYDMQLSAQTAQVIVRQSINPDAVAANVLAGIGLFFVAIVCFIYGDRHPNYNGWIVLLGYVFIAVGNLRLKYRAYRFRHNGEFLKAAFIDIAVFLLHSTTRLGTVLLIAMLIGALLWIFKVSR